MSPPNFPDGSRENPAIIPETEAPDGSQENPAMIIDVDDAPPPPPPPPRTGLDDVGMQSLLQAMDIVENHYEEQENQRKRRLEEENLARDEERARARKLRKYESAKRYALELHSGEKSEESSKVVEKQSNEGLVKGKGKEKSLFQEAREGVEQRKREAIWSNDGDSDSDCVLKFELLSLRKPPSLLEMSARVLAKNCDAIESLNLVPDHLRKKISNLVSDLGRVDARFMEVLIQDSPSEIVVRNCVELVEKDLIKILCDCDNLSLKVLSLDLCGRAMTENAITEFLKHSPEGFPSLTKLSLKGAFCLTDNALALLSKAAPQLLFINLSECSYLTSNAVEILAENFGTTLRGLNLGGCQGIKIFHPGFERSLSKFTNLNYFSVPGINCTGDSFGGFMGLFMSCGSNLTALSLAFCNQVTDTFILSVANSCPNLEALDISDLSRLTDASLQYIADGCRYLNSVKLTKNRFSDEAVAAFLEVCGGSLNELCLNNVRDVGEYTAISLAKFCKSLRFLDLSWCRKLTEGELRRILSSCSLLKSVKLFGWTQVNGSILDELSRAQVHITGLRMKSVYTHPNEYFPGVDAKFF